MNKSHHVEGSGRHPTSFSRGVLAAIVVAAVCLCGCAQNAILEVELTLPPDSDTTPSYARIQFRRAEQYPFDIGWAGSDPESIPLGPEPVRTETSVVTTEPRGDLHVKIRVCAEAGCLGLNDDRAPELWFVIEHPFYEGERTYWIEAVQTLPAGVPTEPSVVDKCQVRGCIEGEVSSYCRLDGSHFCEE